MFSDQVFDPKDRPAMRRLPVKDVVIEDVAEELLSGSIIVYPTDTVYGLGCDSFNPKAVARLKRIKKRKARPLPLLVGSAGIAEDFGYFSPKARTLAGLFWPGKLTLVVKEKVKFPDSVTCGSGAVGLRVPNHSFLLGLLQYLTVPIIGTSANISGTPPATTADEAEQQLGPRVDLVIDGGRSQTLVPSTVVDLSSPRMKLLRAGAIPFEEIKLAIRSSDNL